MKIINRHGNKEDIKFDKITDRIKYLSKDLLNVDPIIIAQKVCARISDGMKTSDLDELSAKICANEGLKHYDYSILASKIIIDNHQKNTTNNLKILYTNLYNNVNKIILHSREGAIDFYKKHGYEVIKKTHILYNSIQHWMMLKNNNISI